MKDGRNVSGLSSFEIFSIVSNIAEEKINPDKEGGTDGVKSHFRKYNTSIPEMGWEAESPKVVLNRIFHQRIEVVKNFLKLFKASFI